MDTDTRFNVTPRMVLGMTLALAGVMLTLDRLGVAPIGRLFRYWPVPIMLIGGLMFAQARDSRERFRGAVLGIVGTWLFLSSQGLLRVNVWELFWPVMLIVLGARLVFVPHRSWPRRPRHRHWPTVPPPPFDGPPPSCDPSSSRFSDGGATEAAHDATTSRDTEWARGFTTDSGERISIFSVMSHIKRASNAARFRGGDITAFMGGGQLDLRLANILPGDEAVLDIVTVMGGVEVYAPAHWEISTPILPFMGGVEDKRLPPLPGDPAAKNGVAPRLVLRGFVMMGSVEIK